MKNSVMIAYPSGNLDLLEVSYSIEQTDDLQTISCSVECAKFPLWLQLRKFSFSSVKKQGRYTTLFSEVNNSRNMDTTLFIDLVYSSIMSTEHCQYS